MPKGLIIVESPAKASTISKFLKQEYTVKASMGHVRDLPKHAFGVDVAKNFLPAYETEKAKSKVIGELREALKGVKAVYLASDHDREGEAIAWHLSKVLEKEMKGKSIHRITFNEITSKAIVSAIENPGNVDMAKVDAQQARRVLDRIVGYTVSPLLWKVIAKDLSAGRVQSVALRLICERETEILNFVPREFWKLEASMKAPVYFTHPLCPWERGTVENTIGLLRQYLPKRTDLRTVDEATLQACQDALNSRPRKSLGYLTPDEARTGKRRKLITQKRIENPKPEYYEKYYLNEEEIKTWRFS